MEEIRTFTDWNNQLNYNFNNPSEAGLRKELNGLANIASQADISVKATEDIRDNIGLYPKYYNDEYTNNRMSEVGVKLDAMVNEKSMEKTNRMNPIKTF